MAELPPVKGPARCRLAPAAHAEGEPRDALRARSRGGSSWSAPLGDTRAASKRQGKQPLAPVAAVPPSAAGRASARLAGALPRDCDHPTLAGRRPPTHHPIRRALGGCLEPERALRRAHLLLGPGRCLEPERAARRALTHLLPPPSSPNRSGQRRRAARGARLRSATRDSVQGARPAPLWCRRSVLLPSFVRTLQPTPRRARS